MTDKQMQEYLKKYPQLDKVEIDFLMELCSMTGKDLDKAIVELAEAVLKIQEQYMETK